jgi:hypothetical protein
MICDFITKRLIYLVLYSVVGLCFLAGCNNAAGYKADADQLVYDIIDRKWDGSFGSQVNYKISDTEPAPGDIQIEKALAASGIVTIPEAVALATAHNRQYQLEKELLYISALDLRLARHEFEPFFFGKAWGGYARAGEKDLAGVGTGFDPDQAVQEATERRFDPDRLMDEPTGTGFGFNQLLTDGTIISAEIALAWGRILSGDMVGEALASVFRTNITKPLLRGSHREVVMENLTQAERDTLYQLRSFNRFRKVFVILIVSQYYMTLQQLDLLRNAQSHYETLSELYEQVEKLVDAGRLLPLELDRLEQEKLRTQDRIVEAQKLYKQALDEFKITLSLPPSVELQLDPDELEAVRVAKMGYPDFAEEQAVDVALSQRLDLVNSADAIGDAERKVFVAADGLGAELNLVSRTYIPSRDLTSDSRHFTDWAQALLEMDVPVDRVLEQNIYRKALITLLQKQREYEEATDIVALEVRQAYRDLTEAAERYRIQAEGLELARKRYDNTLLLLQYRRTNSRRVLRAQRDYFDAQNIATEALVNYTIATLNFYRDTGVIQVRPDGMWQL